MDKAKKRERVLKIIDDLTLFDDELMSRVFERNEKATELLLKELSQNKLITM